MNRIFDGWKKQDDLISTTGAGFKLDHKIGFRKHSNAAGADMTISADLIKEANAKTFDLYRRDNVFALVPNVEGCLYIGKDSNRVAGIGKYAIFEVAEVCGLDITEQVQHVNAIVIDGAIIFPKERIFKTQEVLV